MRALMLVSHQLRAETRSTIARSCHFVFDGLPSWERFLRFDRAIHAYVRHMVLKLTMRDLGSILVTPGERNPCFTRNEETYIQETRVLTLQSDLRRVQSCDIMLPYRYDLSSGRSTTKGHLDATMMHMRNACQGHGAALLFPIGMTEGGRIRFLYDDVRGKRWVRSLSPIGSDSISMSDAAWGIERLAAKLDSSRLDLER